MFACESGQETRLRLRLRLALVTDALGMTIEGTDTGQGQVLAEIKPDCTFPNLTSTPLLNGLPAFRHGQ